jgi:hypothetical protein
MFRAARAGLIGGRCGTPAKRANMCESGKSAYYNPSSPLKRGETIQVTPYSNLQVRFEVQQRNVCVL